MIKIENTNIYGFEAAFRGMRNPKNSWDKSDSTFIEDSPILGPNDLKLAMTLANAGDDHGKFLRFITVTCDITAPHFWWPEMDQYKVGTVTDSCSKMHTLLDKPFEISDFSFDSLFSQYTKEDVVNKLNVLRGNYLSETEPSIKRQLWRSILELLPLSYNQTRTWQGNYQVLKRIYYARKDHKLYEWHKFCDWITTLPYAEELMHIEEDGE